MVGFVDFFLGESPDFLQWRTVAESGSPSWIARQVSKEPSGNAEVGLVRKARVSSEDAAMTAGFMSAVASEETVRLSMVAAMSSTWTGRSLMNFSMEQSWTEHVDVVLLQVSLRMCWPNLAAQLAILIF